MTHANAYLTPRGRLALAKLVVEDGWSLRRAAERFQCSADTARRWANRYRDGGEDAMGDRSSRPRTCPHRTPTCTERRIVKLRFTRRWGPHRIAYHLHLAKSTVEAVLKRFKMPKLAHLDQGHRPAGPPTGPAPLRARTARRPDPHRHQEARPHPRRRRAPQTRPSGRP